MVEVVEVVEEVEVGEGHDGHMCGEVVVVVGAEVAALVSVVSCA